jgi:hypothetical protein
MTRRDLLRLLVRIFGLIILVSAVVGLPWSIYGFVHELSFFKTANAIFTWRDFIFLVARDFGPFVAYAAVGVCFLWFSEPTIEWASPAPEWGEALVESADLQNITISLIAVLGLYFLADGLAELCRVGFGEIIYYPLRGQPSLIWDGGTIVPLVQASMKFVIGIALVLGRGGAVAALRQGRLWVRKLRTWPD